MVHCNVMSSFKFRVLVVLFIWILRIGYMVKEDMKHLSPGSTNHNIWGGGGVIFTGRTIFLLYLPHKIQICRKEKNFVATVHYR